MATWHPAPVEVKVVNIPIIYGPGLNAPSIHPKGGGLVRSPDFWLPSTLGIQSPNVRGWLGSTITSETQGILGSMLPFSRIFLNPGCFHESPRKSTTFATKKPRCREKLDDSRGDFRPSWCMKGWVGDFMIPETSCSYRNDTRMSHVKVAVCAAVIIWWAQKKPTCGLRGNSWLKNEWCFAL